MKIHPAHSVDFSRVADIFGKAISGQSEHWDKDMIMMHPEMAGAGREEAEQVLNNCVDRGLISDYIEYDDHKAKDLIQRWCDLRKNEVKTKMVAIQTVDGYVKAHRIIIAKSSEIKNPVGIFWSHDFDNWADPSVPWGSKDKDDKTIVLEAQIPIEAVDWEVSAIALMSWLLGDCESELRLRQGCSIKLTDAWFLDTEEKIELPRLDWRS